MVRLSREDDYSLQFIEGSGDGPIYAILLQSAFLKLGKMRHQAQIESVLGRDQGGRRASVNEEVYRLGRNCILQRWEGNNCG